MAAKTQEQLGLFPTIRSRAASLAPAAPTFPVQWLQALPAVSRQLGLDHALLVQEARLDPGLSFDHAQRIAYSDLERLFQAYERRSSCDHVGLLLGQRTRLRDLGAVASAALRERTTGMALHNFVAHCNLHDTPATARLTVQDRHALFALSLGEHSLLDSRQFEYMGIAIAFNVLQDLFGPHWKPETVRFSSRAPIAATAIESMFRAPIAFEAGIGGIEFDADWLERPLPDLEPGLRASMNTELQQLRADVLADLPATLRRVLRKRLLAGDFSMDDVAAQLSMHRRTLDRRLQRSGTTYGELLESLRYEIARQLLRETQFTIQRVAESLRFSSAANFATAFRRRAGMTPTEFRRRTA